MSEFSTVGDGYREMMRLPESERLDYMVKYTQVLEETGDAARDETYQLLERVGELEAEREGLKNAVVGISQDEPPARWRVSELERQLEKLEAENEALHTALKASGERRERLEAENARLREAVKRARAYLWQADDGKGLDEMLRQATHPQPE